MKTKLLLAALLASVLPATAAAAHPAGKHRGVVHTYVGKLAAAPTATSLTLDVERGNRPALRSLLGQSTQQTFAYDATTEFLLWSRGIPTVVQPSTLHAGDWVRVNVRAPYDAPLATIETTAPGIVGDHVTEPQPPGKPLFLFRGTLAAVGTSTVTVNVAGGNARALRLLLGQPAQQSFTFGSDTIVLLWQGKVPTVISPSQLKVGDRFVVRVRAPRGATLAQVAATPAAHLGDREPAATRST
jgi:hypothetical protein